MKGTFAYIFHTIRETDRDYVFTICKCKITYAYYAFGNHNRCKSIGFTIQTKCGIIYACYTVRTSIVCNF